MECSQRRLIYHKQTIIDEDGVILTQEEMDRTIYKTMKVHVEKKTDQQGQTHVYTTRVVRKCGVQLQLF
nr:MAG TPA: hypothetical protein [Microviridae sp.]